MPDAIMGVFERMMKDGHEQIVFCYDKATGLKAIIAIHDTTLGPALGGCRMWAYPAEEEALDDALRLSKGMTYKSAASGQNHGGGKAVIWGNPKTEKSEELFRAFGKFVGTLGGRFITGTDVGTEKTDFVWSKMESPWFVALPEEYGGSGDSSIITAFGVWKGIKASAMFRWGSDVLKGRRVVVQGLGKVGYHLVEHLTDEGAILTVTDVMEEKVEAVRQAFPNVEAVTPEKIYDIPCDIFSPNALGGVINDETIDRLRCEVVAGSANNQLKELRHGDELHRRGILYAPDYVINGGGLIQVADELMGYDRDRAFRKTASIYDMLLKIYAISRDEHIPTYLAANRLAERRIDKVAQLNRIYMPE
ncbi:MAG: Leu/Phe/Val dehydrogenase [Bacillota bacterium]